MSRGTIKKVAGPLVIAKGMRDANMYDVVRVSSQRLIGEIIEMHEDEASIQVYEETSGLRPGEPVESMEVPLSVELGPGLITSISMISPIRRWLLTRTTSYIFASRIPLAITRGPATFLMVPLLI